MIRLIALDIDGTLLDSSWHVPEANREAVRRAVERGIEVALVTGRRFHFARPVAEAVGTPLTLIVSGGAVVKNQRGDTLARHLLPADVARTVLEATLEFRDSTALAFDRPHPPQVVVETLETSDARRQAYFDRNRDFMAEVVPLEDALTEDPIQVMFSGTVAAMRRLVRTLSSLPVAANCSLAVTEYESRDFSLVDANRAGCTKGATLADWAGSRGYRPHEVMAVGDNFNDLEMLRFAGVPVVMANAVPALKQLGWHETGTNDAAGVAEAIDRFALGQQAL